MPTKMLLAPVVFVFQSAMAALTGPAAIAVIRTVLPMVSGSR